MSGADLSIESLDNQKPCKKSRTRKIRCLVLMMILTFAFFLVEFISGQFLINSNSLTADSFHMLSDLVSFIIALVSIYVSDKKASAKNTFGWGRAEVLGSLINAVFLLALCFSILIEAFKRFFEPQKLERIDLMLIVGLIGLLINLFGIGLFSFLGGHHFHSHSHIHGQGKKESENNGLKFTNKETSIENLDENSENLNASLLANKPIKSSKENNMNIHGVFLHILADFFGSVIVILSGLLIKYVDSNKDVKWKYYVDPVLSILITCFILVSTVPLIKESSLILLQAVPRNLDFIKLHEKINSIKKVKNIHNFHVWSLNSESNIASAHLHLCNDENHEATIQEVKCLLNENNINLITLQIENDFSNCISN